VTSHSPSLAELIGRGADDLAHFLERDRPPQSPLEWLGIAVSRIPALTATARTADDVSGRTRPAPPGVRAPLLDALARELGAAAALIEQARERLVAQHPGCDSGGIEEYAEIVAAGQRSSPRRSEMMIGAYASFLGTAVETAGSLAEAEIGMASARRWDRADHASVAETRAGQLSAALNNTLGGLLAYARLLTEDSAELRG
jgi:hypothetical protein